jgi:hypothetical protein
MQEGYLPINVKFADRHKYYNCFNDYHQSGGNPKAMTEMITAYTEETLERYLSIISN